MNPTKENSISNIRKTLCTFCQIDLRNCIHLNYISCETKQTVANLEVALFVRERLLQPPRQEAKFKLWHDPSCRHPKSNHNKNSGGCFLVYSGNANFQFNLINLIYLFMSRHEVHSMSTHTLQNAG